MSFALRTALPLGRRLLSRDFHVISFYHFVERSWEPQAALPTLRAIAHAAGVKGTIILAAEGVNGSLAGDDLAQCERVLAAIAAAEPALAGLAAKNADETDVAPFRRLKLKLKKEAVTLGLGAASPTIAAATSPAEWDALIADPSTLLLDVRNDWEVALGSFEGASGPATVACGDSFQAFPSFARQLAAKHASRCWQYERIAMFCTGGVRCEKASAQLTAAGLPLQVSQLDGGILAYLRENGALREKGAADTSAWRGECFVFDDRTAVKPYALDAETGKPVQRCVMQDDGDMRRAAALLGKRGGRSLRTKAAAAEKRDAEKLDERRNL